MKTRPFKCGVIIATMTVALAACSPPADVYDIYDIGEWRDILEKTDNANWHIVPIPDSKLTPGSIVRITEVGGLNWIDNLQSCGVPSGLLKATRPDSETPTLVIEGSSPSIQFTKKVEFGAAAMLNIAGVQAGPDFKMVKRVRLVIGQNGGDAVRLLALKKWIRDNLDKFEKDCLDEFAKPDRYLVSESFRFSSATYEMFDETGAKISLTVPKLGKLLDLEPSVKYGISADGSLSIDQVMYVAIKNAKSTKGSFDTLGTLEDGGGDAILKRFNAKLK